MKRRRSRNIRYSADEMAWLEANRQMPIGACARAFNATFDRDISEKNLHGLRKRKGWRTGRTGRFERGSVPPNKGKPCPPGVGGNHPNARKTQFKPGVRRGGAVKLYKAIGTERFSKDGYLERKIHDGMPLQSRWRAVHLIRWEDEHGPLPKGMCLKRLGGDKLNTDPSNWKMISRAELAILNRRWDGLNFEEAPDALKPAILAIAQVKHASARRSRASAQKATQQREAP